MGGGGNHIGGVGPGKGPRPIGGRRFGAIFGGAAPAKGLAAGGSVEVGFRFTLFPFR